MKHIVSPFSRLTIALLFLFSLSLNGVVCGQASNETTINSQYRELITTELKNDVAQRQTAMQKRAEAMLLNLPNERKLYNESEVLVKARLADGIREDGKAELNYVIELSYNCKSIEGSSDDYSTGNYLLENSNSAMALCQITREIVNEMNSDVFTAGKQVSIRISSSADALKFKKLDYKGEYGDHRYVGAVYNGEMVRLSLMDDEDITSNAQLAFARAQGVRQYLDTQVEGLQQTTNDYFFITRCSEEPGAYYRRVSIELTVHAAFDEVILQRNEQLINDNYIEYNIPLINPGTNSKTFVVIVANEAYDAPLPNCEYAWRDGAVFRDYCIRTLGIPERQVRMLTNASKNTIYKKGYMWVHDALQAIGGDGNVIFYYAGHGISDGDYNAYILPCDINYRSIRSWVGKSEFDPENQLSKHDANALFNECIRLDTLCTWFGQIRCNNTTFILDASFNNNRRDGEPLITVKRTTERIRGLRIRSDIVIFNAANVEKTAYSFDEMRHGFLTYYMLKEIKRTKGDITYGNLFNTIMTTVPKESALQGKLQEPEIIAGGKVKDSWVNMRFR